MSWTEADKVSFLELNPELRSILEDLITRDQFNQVVNGFNSHVDNKDVHITADERVKWNSNLTDAKKYVDEAILKLGDFGGVDVKKYVDDVKTTVDSHSTNSDIHVSKEDKDRWDKSSGDNTKYTDKAISDLETKLMKYIDDVLSTIISKLQSGSISTSRVNGIRVTISNDPPTEPELYKEMWIAPAKSLMYQYGPQGWTPIYPVYR